MISQNVNIFYWSSSQNLTISDQNWVGEQVCVACSLKSPVAEKEMEKLQVLLRETVTSDLLTEKVTAVVKQKMVEITAHKVRLRRALVQANRQNCSGFSTETVNFGFPFCLQFQWPQFDLVYGSGWQSLVWFEVEDANENNHAYIKFDAMNSVAQEKRGIGYQCWYLCFSCVTVVSRFGSKLYGKLPFIRLCSLVLNFHAHAYLFNFAYEYCKHCTCGQGLE